MYNFPLETDISLPRKKASSRLTQPALAHLFPLFDSVLTKQFSSLKFEYQKQGQKPSKSTFSELLKLTKGL